MPALRMFLSLMLGALVAQDPQPRDIEAVAAVLRSCDPVRSGMGAAELLGPGLALEVAIRATAANEHADRVVRLRALRLVRALDLAQRVNKDRTRRDVAWWLAFDELDREMPVDLRSLLLGRTGLQPTELANAHAELAAATRTADAFCLEWNEVREQGAAHEAQNRRYDALEADLKKAGLAAVPRLLNILVVPPDIAFSGNDAREGFSARQQVKAILALGNLLQARDALPYLVMHTRGPSLTQSSDAATMIQSLTGEHFGAAFLCEGDDAALLAWWKQHLGEHRVVLDHLVQHLLRIVDSKFPSRGAQRSEGLWCAVMRLERALGNDAPPAGDASVEVLRARLDDAESECLRPGWH